MVSVLERWKEGKGWGTDGILVHELIAREAEDDEVIGVFFFDFLVEGFETFELWGEAAFGGGVYDEDDFVFEGGERVGLAFLWGWVSWCSCSGRWGDVGLGGGDGEEMYVLSRGSKS